MSTGSLLHCTFGAYRLTEFVGAGGMGEVYRAVHSSLGRVVAVKVLTGTRGVPGLGERFRNEARIQATLHHPNIATLYDFFESSGRPCIVMEYVEGDSLSGRIERNGHLPVDQALRILADLAAAADYLHQRGIIHRDLKSTNVKVTPDGQVKLLDFGIAKGAQTPRLTATGHMVGTIDYMAPEQIALQPADARTDIWSLGVILYEMLTGRLPFAGQTVADVMRRILEADYFPAGSVKPGLPPAVDRLVAGCLRVRPADRFAGARQLAERAGALADGLTAAPSPRRAPALGRELLHRVRDTGARVRRWFHGFTVAPAALYGGAITIVAVAAALVIAQTGRHTFPPPPPPPPPGSDPERSIDLAACGLVTPATRSDLLRTIRIETAGGPAEVYCAGRFLARTPFTGSSQLGSEVQLLLRRDGHRDLPVRFTVTESRRSFMYRLEPRPAPGLQGQRWPPGPGSPLLAGWFPFLGGLLRRRRDRARDTRVASGAGPGATNLSLESLDVQAIGIELGIRSDRGCVRDSNEDSIGFSRPEDPAELGDAGVLLVVADGMGGHLAGEVASRLAVETLIASYAIDSADPQAALVRAVRQANQVIRDAAARDAALQGMGTTCTALVVRQGRAYCAHVGDSRLYLVRDGSILQLTEDHSAVFDLVKRGMLDRDLARQHPDRNVIVRALGSRAELEVAAWPRPLFVRHDDRFVVATDGLHDLVDDAEIMAAVMTHPPDPACERLVALARERGGHDNISVGILHVRSHAEAEGRSPAGTAGPSEGDVDGRRSHSPAPEARR